MLASVVWSLSIQWSLISFLLLVLSLISLPVFPFFKWLGGTEGLKQSNFLKNSWFYTEYQLIPSPWQGSTSDHQLIWLCWHYPSFCLFFQIEVLGKRSSKKPRSFTLLLLAWFQWPSWYGWLTFFFLERGLNGGGNWGGRKIRVVKRWMGNGMTICEMRPKCMSWGLGMHYVQQHNRTERERGRDVREELNMR